MIEHGTTETDTEGAASPPSCSRCGDGCRADFPFFSHHPDVAYLDNAATSQKPRAVLDAFTISLEQTNANVHRGAYPIAEEASRGFERARRAIAQFINAPSADQIVFTKNATEALNIAAHGIASTVLQSGDEVLLSSAEHHANLLPWQQYAARCGATLSFIPVNREGELDLDVLRSKISPRTKVVSVTHCSNVLGVLHPIPEIAELAHRVGATVVVDGAQSVAHLPIDVTALGCDVPAFSGHKMCGPTGIGVLYARKELLEKWPPLLLGGGMVDSVEFDRSSFAPPPHRFEAGTPPIAEVMGLEAAATYLKSIGMKAISTHCHALRELAVEGISTIPGIEIIGPSHGGNAGGILSFVIPDIHNHDLAWYCGERGVCLRAGSHCAHPLLKSLGYQGSVRASFYLYNTARDVSRFIETLRAAARSLLK